MLAARPQKGTRLQTSGRERFRGAWHCARLTLRSEGLGAFWKGVTPTLVGAMPGVSELLVRAEVAGRSVERATKRSNHAKPLTQTW